MEDVYAALLALGTDKWASSTFEEEGERMTIDATQWSLTVTQSDGTNAQRQQRLSG